MDLTMKVADLGKIYGGGNGINAVDL